MTREDAQLPFQVEIELLQTLHGSLTTLFAGTFGVAATASICCLASGEPILYWTAALVLAASIFRFLTTYCYRRSPSPAGWRQLNVWKRRTIVTGALSSATLGACGLLGVSLIDDSAVRLALAICVIGHAASASSRNAGLPACVRWQLALSVAPLAIAFLAKGGLSNLAVGLLQLAAIPAMANISQSAYLTLVKALVVSRQKHMLAEELTEQAAISHAAMDNMSHGLAMFDVSVKLVICNRRFADLFGLDEESASRGASSVQIMRCARRANLLPLDGAARLEALFVLKAQTCAAEDMTLAFLDGRILELSFQPMARGGAVVVAHDVTERKAQDAKIAHMARFDKLTGLPNRSQFEEKFNEILARAQRDGRPFAVVSIDLDHFKEVNDTLTHMVGDQLLIAAAARMKDAIRATDLIARFGGDEFVLILPTLHPERAADEISLALNRLIEIVSEPYEIDSHTIVIGMSAGVAVAPNDGTARDDILRASDLALYEAKQQGRGAFRFFQPALDEAAQERRQIALDMRSGLALKQFVLEYQPIVDLETGRIASCEALMRWRLPGKQIPPSKFIAIAEDTGMIGELGRWALRQACIDAAAWPFPVPVAVNLSPAQFRRDNLVETVERILFETGLDPSRLELEITETLLISKDEATRKAIDGLVGMGCSLSLDDFGAGYSTFGYLISFPFAKVKLDKGFIDHIETRPEHRAIIRAVGQMAADMSMSIVAEGVETQAQLDILRTEKVHYAQGWLFSKSVASNHIPWTKFERGRKARLRVA